MLDELDNRLIDICKENGLEENQIIVLVLMKHQYSLDSEFESFLNKHKEFTWDEIFEHHLQFCPEVELNEDE